MPLYTFIKKHSELLLVLFLFLVVGFLRFKDLGYSDYISDEPGTFLYRGLPHKFPGVKPWQFLLDQKKGPIQIFVGFIPYFFIGNYNNELAQRIPFALFNTFSVILLYFAVKKLTKSKLIGFLASVFFGVSGFSVAFGRVAQYQSLNMFFSFAALYFYAFLLSKEKLAFRYSLLGTLFLSLSILSHWDAVYIVPVILFIFVKFLVGKEYDWKFKLRVLFGNFLLGCVLLLPFLLPYVSNYFENARNQSYFASRVGLRETFDSSGDLFMFKLYNPFLVYEVYIGGIMLGFLAEFLNLVVLKKKQTAYGAFTLWFVIVFCVYKFFIHHAGTHIYNLVIPVVILGAIGLGTLINILPKFFKVIPALLALLLFSFFYYQSYIIFVDHSIEYPWRQESIFEHDTFDYASLKTNIRHLIGFPHKRYWQEINRYLVSQNELLDEKFGYISNEDKGLTGYYMTLDSRNHGGFYVVGVKRPLSFTNDYKMSHIKDKSTVHTIKNEDGDTVVRIYRVEDTPDD